MSGYLHIGHSGIKVTISLKLDFRKTSYFQKNSENLVIDFKSEIYYVNGKCYKKYNNVLMLYYG